MTTANFLILLIAPAMALLFAGVLFALPIPKAARTETDDLCRELSDLRKTVAGLQKLVIGSKVRNAQSRKPKVGALKALERRRA